MKEVKKLRVAISAALALSCLTLAASSLADSLTFEGMIVEPSCDAVPSSPQVPAGYQYCPSFGGAAQVMATSVYSQQMSKLPSHSDIALLDHFAQRPDGGTKYLVTRDYE